MTRYVCRVCEKPYELPGPAGKQVVGKICPPCLEWHHWCGTCKTANVRSEFAKNVNKPRGLGSMCRKCVLRQNLKLLHCVACDMECMTTGQQEVDGKVRKYNKRSKYVCDDCFTKVGHCNKCDQVRPIDDFRRTRRSGPGKYTYCKPCMNRITSESPHSRNRVVRQYGLTSDEYEKMLAEQDFKCKICRRPQPKFSSGRQISLAIDHCHRTGRVRGLLCSGCNRALGYLDDDPKITLAAALYLINAHA